MPASTNRASDTAESSSGHTDGQLAASTTGDLTDSTVTASQPQDSELQDSQMTEVTLYENTLASTLTSAPVTLARGQSVPYQMSGMGLDAPRGPGANKPYDQGSSWLCPCRNDVGTENEGKLVPVRVVTSRIARDRVTDALQPPVLSAALSSPMSGPASVSASASAGSAAAGAAGLEGPGGPGGTPMTAPVPAAHALRTEYEYLVRFAGYNIRCQGWYAEAALVPIPAEELDAHRALLDTVPTEQPKNIEHVVVGAYKMSTWYYSPFPDDYPAAGADTVYVCEFCFAFLKSERSYRRHLARCLQRCPPGDEIYRDGFISLFEVSGANCKTYCRNICLVARLFLLHKTLLTDTDLFNFYVMLARTNRRQGAAPPPGDGAPDEDSYHFVGYFSKELEAENTLSCILTLPCYQKQSFGRLLIEASYMLGARENRIGGPEKPLSDLGYVSYYSYWRRKIAEFLALHAGKTVTLQAVCRATLISLVDAVYTLKKMSVLLRRNGYASPVLDACSGYVIYFTPDMLDYLRTKVDADRARGVHYLDDRCLHWVPAPSMTYAYRARSEDYPEVLVPDMQ